MKKITLVVSVGLISLCSFGQQKTIMNAPRTIVNPKLWTPSNHTFRGDPSNSRVFSGWLNYALQLDGTGGPSVGAAAGHYGLVFPDSNIIAGKYTNGTTAYPQFHKYATMLDPKNMPVQGILANSSYTLDSISVIYAYDRHLASTIVDTLVVNIIKEVSSLNTNMGAPGNENYQDITYVPATNSVTSTMILKTIKYFLTQSDSSNSASELFLATTGIPAQSNGAHIGAVVSFIPGYSYSITDSLNHKNAFYLLSYEQNGLNSDPTYYGGAPHVYSGDMNCSYTLPTDVRYNINTNGWNGYFLPTWAWATGYGYENHLISFKFSEILGINELSENGIKVMQNVPNPTRALSTINYELDQNANISLTVYDVVGKKISVQNEGTQSAGKHSIIFNSENLSAGVYYYSLSVGQKNTSTMKMVVVK